MILPSLLFAFLPALTAFPATAVSSPPLGSPPSSNPAQGDGKPADFPARIRKRLGALAASKGNALLLRYGTSREGRPLVALRLTRAGAVADAHPRPSILVVAGLDGRRIDDVEVAMGVIEAFLDTKEGGPAEALSKADLYVIPCANPDGLAATAEGPPPTAGNGAPLDEDRDLREGEDPPDDLNGDGRISWMRIPDPGGEWIEDPERPGRMRKADPSKNERGRFLLVPEGKDDDGDGLWNEDPKGGVLPQRNFPHLYPEHSRGAGAFVCSEPCARALAEFCVANPAIAAVLVFGEEDNLRGDPRGNDAGERRPPTGILPEDLPFLKECAKLYRELTKVGPGGRDRWEGRFHATAYAVLGRWPLATSLGPVPPPEVPDLVGAELARIEREEGKGGKDRSLARNPPATRKPPKTKPRTAKEASRPSSRPTSGPDERKAREAGEWLPWKPFRIPGFGEVEIGGLVLGSAQRLPKDEIPTIARTQAAFLSALIDRLPAPRISKVEVRSLAKGVVEVEALVANEGFLPPLTEMGKRLRNPRKPRVEIWIRDPDRDEPRLLTPADRRPKLLIGRPWNFLEGLRGKGTMRRFRWILSTKGVTRIELRILQEGILHDRKEVRL